MTIFLFLYIIEITAEFGVGLTAGMPQGLSIKNLFLYLLCLTIAIRLCFNRDFRQIKPFSGIHLLFIALIIYSSLSILFYQVSGLQMRDDFSQLIAGVKNLWLDPYFIFLIYSYYCNTEHKARWILISMLGFMVFCGAVTIVEGYIPAINIFGYDGERPNGPAGEPNMSASILSMFFPFSASLAFGAKSRRTLYTLATIIILASIAVTGSRGGLGGAVCGLFIMLFLTRRQLGIGKKISLSIFGPLILIAAWFIIPPQMQSLLLERFGVFQSSQVDWNDASAGRTDIWANAIQAWLNSPIFGSGWAAFISISKLATHNSYLTVLVNIGLVGLFLYLAIFIKIFRILFRTAKVCQKHDYFLICGIIGGIISLMVSTFFVNLGTPWIIVWAFLGIVMSLSNILYNNRTQPLLRSTPEQPTKFKGNY